MPDKNFKNKKSTFQKENSGIEKENIKRVSKQAELGIERESGYQH